MAKKRQNTYTVRIKVSYPGCKSLFVSGIALAAKEDRAKQISIDFLLENLNKQNSALNLTRDNLTVIKTVKLKDEFIVNENQLAKQ